MKHKTIETKVCQLNSEEREMIDVVMRPEKSG